MSESSHLRIVLLSQWYPPEPNFKVRPLAKGLLARGHEVKAITGFPNYPSGRLYPGYQIRWRQWETYDGTTVLRLPLYPSHDRSALRRFLNYLSFAASASFLGPWLCGPADVMWVYHPPLTVGIPAWWISRLWRMPFIYEIQDLWPETLAATGMVSSPQIMGWVSRLANFIYQQAAAIIVISPGFKRNLISKGVPAEKIEVIPNWANEEIYYPMARDPALGTEYGLAGRFNIVYGGNLGAAQAMDNVLQAAARLRDLPEIQFVLVGDGMDKDRLRQTAQEQGLNNIRFIDWQPAEKVAGFFAWAEGLLVHLKRDSLFAITIPSKTITYLACGRPILCAVAGDAAEVVQSAGAGLICPPEDPVALAQAARTLYSMTADQREKMGQAGRRTFLTQYTQKVLMNRYEELFTMVANFRQQRRLNKL